MCGWEILCLAGAPFGGLVGAHETCIPGSLFLAALCRRYQESGSNRRRGQGLELVASRRNPPKNSMLAGLAATMKGKAASMQEDAKGKVSWLDSRIDCCTKPPLIPLVLHVTPSLLRGWRVNQDVPLPFAFTTAVVYLESLTYASVNASFKYAAIPANEPNAYRKVETLVQ